MYLPYCFNGHVTSLRVKGVGVQCFDTGFIAGLTECSDGECHHSALLMDIQGDFRLLDSYIMNTVL